MEAISWICPGIRDNLINLIKFVSRRGRASDIWSKNSAFSSECSSVGSSPQSGRAPWAASWESPGRASARCHVITSHSPGIESRHGPRSRPPSRPFLVWLAASWKTTVSLRSAVSECPIVTTREMNPRHYPTSSLSSLSSRSRKCLYVSPLPSSFFSFSLFSVYHQNFHNLLCLQICGI